MNYTWDPRKNRSNLVRHGIAFEDAVGIFEGPTLERVNDRVDYGEIRVYAIGVVNGIEITVIYSDVSESERRIISAWRAERHEREAYWKTLSKAPASGRTDWKHLRSLTDQQISKAIKKDPEARATDAVFWEKAKVVMPQPKQTVTMRLDADLLKWLGAR